MSLNPFRRPPPRVALAIGFVEQWIVFFGLTLLDGRHGEQVWPRVLQSGGEAVVVTVLLALLLRRRDRRPAETIARWRAVGGAIRSGALPDDADPTTWVPDLRLWRSHRQTSVWLSPLLGIGMTVLSVLVALTMSPFWWVLAAISGWSYATGGVPAALDYRSAGRLLDEVERREAATATRETPLPE